MKASLLHPEKAEDEKQAASRRLAAEREWMVSLPEAKRKPSAVTARTFRQSTTDVGLSPPC